MSSIIEDDSSKDEYLEQFPKELQSTFYPDSPKNIFWLSMASGGFYDYLWFYRHWRHMKRRAVESKKQNRENLIKYDTDINISPFWSTFFCGFYIVGTARRIRDRLRSIGTNEWETGPWWAFWLFLFGSLGTFNYGLTENIVTNISMLLAHYIFLALASWQIARLQIKANQSILLSKEMENINRRNLKGWDLFILVFGLLVTLRAFFD